MAKVKVIGEVKRSKYVIFLYKWHKEPLNMRVLTNQSSPYLSKKKLHQILQPCVQVQGHKIVKTPKFSIFKDIDVKIWLEWLAVLIKIH